MTTDELERLRAERVSPDEHMWVAHYFSHFGSSRSERTAFRAELKSAGFGESGEVSADEEITGDGYWHHYAFTKLNASVERCEELDKIARAVADKHGVRYDHWEVVRDREGNRKNLTGRFVSACVSAYGFFNPAFRELDRPAASDRRAR
jgi:Regulator of ribonuclease activity B